jgi:hypothetical protein
MACSSFRPALLVVARVPARVGRNGGIGTTRVLCPGESRSWSLAGVADTVRDLDRVHPSDRQTCAPQT